MDLQQLLNSRQSRRSVLKLNNYFLIAEIAIVLAAQAAAQPSADPPN